MPVKTKRELVIGNRFEKFGQKFGVCILMFEECIASRERAVFRSTFFQSEESPLELRFIEPVP